MDERAEYGINTHKVFGALTRPAMTAGVTFEMFIINAMVSVLALISTGNLLYALIFIPVHLVSVAVCQYDPWLFSVLWKYMDIPKGRNNHLWGVKCYEPD